MKRTCHCLGLILLMGLVLVSGGGCTKKARANRALKAANSDFEAEKYDAAEIEYKNALRLGGVSATAIGQIGRIYSIDGKNNEARVYLLKAIELEPKNISYQLALGKIYVDFHDSSNALRTALLVLSAQPTNDEALLQLLNSYGPFRQIQQAVQNLPRAEENPAYHIALGTLALREEKLDEAGNQFRLAVSAHPKYSQAYYALAEFDAVRKDEKQAETALQNAAAFAPLRSPIRIKYVDYLYRSGATDQAWKVLHEMTDKAPDYIPGWISSMNVALGEKKYDEADKYATMILTRDNRNYDGMLGRGMISEGRGDGAKAAAELENMASIYRRSPQVRYELAMAYIATHDKVKWAANLNQALALDPTFTQAALLLAQLDIRTGDAPMAVDVLNRFIKKQPRVGQAYLLLADAYMAEKKPDNAILVYQKLIDAMPTSPQVPLMLGIALSGQHRVSEARAAFEKSLSLAPDFLGATEQLIDLDLAEAKYSDATALAEEQINKRPKAAEPWEILAKIDIAQTNLAPAATALLKAISLNPDLSTPYLLLAQVYVHGSNYQDALQKLNTLVARTNDAPAYLQIGAIRDEIKEFDAARDAYEKVLTINPRSIPALNNLAYIYAVRLNKIDRASELAQKARELRPYDPHVEDTLGWVLFKKGDYPRALTLLEDSSERAPGDAEIEFHLGMTHYMMDEEDSARVALQRAVVTQQDYANKEEAKKALAVVDMDTSKAGPSVLAGLEKALAEHPNDPVILNRIGALQEQEGAVDKAAATYESALKKNPEAVHIMTKLAWLYSSRLNQPEKALSMANDAHKLAPESAEVNGVLGHCVFRNGDYVWSLSLLENASDRLPNQPALLYDLAWAYYAVGRIADAAATMQKALQSGLGSVEGEDAKRFVALADAFSSPAKVQAATGQAQTILQSDAKYVPALMVSGAAAERAGNFKAAQDAYYKALDVFPRFMPAARQMAVLDARHFTDDARGCEWGEKAHNANPDDLELTKSVAILNYSLAKYSRSAELLRETIARNGDDGELYYYLGLDYRQLKRTTETKQALGKALALKIPDKLAVQAKQIMAELR